MTRGETKNSKLSLRGRKNRGKSSVLTDRRATRGATADKGKMAQMAQMAQLQIAFCRIAVFPGEGWLWWLNALEEIEIGSTGEGCAQRFAPGETLARSAQAVDCSRRRPVSMFAAAGTQLPRDGKCWYGTAGPGTRCSSSNIKGAARSDGVSICEGRRPVAQATQQRYARSSVLASLSRLSQLLLRRIALLLLLLLLS